MFAIKAARYLASDIKLFHIAAPQIAKKHQAGQFVIVRLHEHGERIPLTIVDTDPDNGTITIVVQGVGKTTKLLNMLEIGDALLDVVGPLGKASDIERFGKVIVIGGGVGAAIAYPIASAMRAAGNHVIGILGARRWDQLILVEEMQAKCDELFVMTDDGSCGEPGLVTDRLQRLLDDGHQIDRVIAIGPIPMMQAVAEVTRPRAIPTIVSLNPIMIDGTGMCGGCRVSVGNQSKFACVDGPEFDGHQVDFRTLEQRNRIYSDQERHALSIFERDPQRQLHDLRECQLCDLHPDRLKPPDR